MPAGPERAGRLVLAHAPAEDRARRRHEETGTGGKARAESRRSGSEGPDREAGRSRFGAPWCTTDRAVPSSRRAPSSKSAHRDRDRRGASSPGRCRGGRSRARQRSRRALDTTRRRVLPRPQPARAARGGPRVARTGVKPSSGTDEGKPLDGRRGLPLSPRRPCSRWPSARRRGRSRPARHARRARRPVSPRWWTRSLSGTGWAACLSGSSRTSSSGRSPGTYRHDATPGTKRGCPPPPPSPPDEITGLCECLTSLRLAGPSPLSCR